MNPADIKPEDCPEPRRPARGEGPVDDVSDHSPAAVTAAPVPYIVTTVLRTQVDATNRTDAMSQVVKALDGAKIAGAEVTRFYNLEACKRDD